MSYDAALALRCELASCARSGEAEWSPALQVDRTDCPHSWLVFNSRAELVPLGQPNRLTYALRHAGCNATKTILPGTALAHAYWNLVESAIATAVDP